MVIQYNPLQFVQIEENIFTFFYSVIFYQFELVET